MRTRTHAATALALVAAGWLVSCSVTTPEREAVSAGPDRTGKEAAAPRPRAVEPTRPVSRSASTPATTLPADAPEPAATRVSGRVARVRAWTKKAEGVADDHRAEVREYARRLPAREAPAGGEARGKSTSRADGGAEWEGVDRALAERTVTRRIGMRLRLKDGDAAKAVEGLAVSVEGKRDAVRGLARHAKAKTLKAGVVGEGGPGVEKAALVTAEETPAPVKPKPRVDRLKGGSRDDNAEWEEYLRFRKEFAANYAGQVRTKNVIDVDVTERRWIVVRDSDGRPVPNATVRVLVGDKEVLSAKTYSNGRTLFFPRAVGLKDGGDFVVEAALGEARKAETFDRNNQGDWTLDLPGKRSGAEPVLDLVFCLDTTGSMSDEIRAIQQCLKHIVASVEELPGKATVRLGLVEYRDRKDKFVSRVDDFTTDVDAFQTRLDKLSANGGGDTPESVNEALHKSVNDVTWTAGPEGVRLVVLVADAPPHMDYPDDVKYADTMRRAHSRAIKIYPIAASGLKKRGEYIFRQLGQYTCAKFLFITYGGGTPHDVKPFKENNLDAIVTNIVRDELTAYRAGMAGGDAGKEPGDEPPARDDEDDGAGRDEEF